MQVEGTCSFSGIENNTSAADAILQLAAKMQVDILAMGVSGYGYGSCFPFPGHHNFFCSSLEWYPSVSVSTDGTMKALPMLAIFNSRAAQCYEGTEGRSLHDSQLIGSFHR